MAGDMKKLLIVESPAKIKTIAKFLGKDFVIMSTVGHIKDLPQKELGVHMNKTIDIDYVVLDKKDRVIKDICREASKSDIAYLAPDPDREGEIIAWHIGEEIKRCAKKTPIARITYNEITKPAIEEALAHPSEIDMNKVAAQQARRVLDRWVGYEVSPVLWRKVGKGLSAGRVQSVTLRLICDREEAIRAFKTEEYWTIDGIFGIDKSTKITAELAQKNKKKIEIKNQKEAEKLASDIKLQNYTITSIKDGTRLKKAPPPLMTSTLQQAAYNQLGFSVDKTMSIAQRLYEGIPLKDSNAPVALITYMRTDSLRLSDTALKASRSYIKKTYGDDYLPDKALRYGKEKAQDAHEAIRPIDVNHTPEAVARYAERDMARLYDLIWRRFVACQMKPAQYAQRQVLIEGGAYTFKATGSTILFDGFQRVYGSDEEEPAQKTKGKSTEERESKTKLPANLHENMVLALLDVLSKQHFTEPPPRYTQASLVKDLEKEGIGRPSTYATILRTIRARAYTDLDEKKRFVPTELGMLVTKMLLEHMPKIMDISFTATMEKDLDAIADGEMERDKVLRTFYKDFEKDVEAFAGQAKRTQEPTGLACPKCKEGELVIRMGKAGSFVGCNKYPACTFTGNFERAQDGSIILKEAEEPKLLDEKCPKCGKPLRHMRGRYGPFISCSGYPDCKYIHQVKAHFPCPLCGGDIFRKTWKGKVFWGCGNYPKCTFSISGDIEQKPCPKCKNPYLSKRITRTGEIFLSCPKKECGYTETIIKTETD